MGGLDWGTPLLESAVTERFALPPSLKEIRNYVDGAFVTTDRTFDNVSPLTGRVLAKVHEADAALVDRAVRAARQAGYSVATKAMANATQAIVVTSEACRSVGRPVM